MNSPDPYRSECRRPPWSAWSASVIGLSLLLPAVGAVAAEPALNWSITPYAWISDTTFDLSVRDRPINGEVAFDDLVDTIDTSLQLVSEAGFEGSQWSAFVDLTYLETSDTNRRPVLQVDSESEQWFVDAAVAWWPGGKERGLSLYGGLRYTDVDERFRFSVADDGEMATDLRNDRSFLDALLGVRQIVQLSDRWTFLAKADYATGESEGIFLLQAALRFGMGRKRQFGAILGYRYKEAELRHDGIEEQFTYQGPVIGFNFQI